MDLLQQSLLDLIVIFTLVLARVGGLVMTAPVFGSQTIPLRVRGLIAVALAMLVTPMQRGTPVPELGTTLDYLVLLGGEALIGLLLGLGVTILFTGIQLAGQIVSQLSGMALADVFSPGLDANVPVVSNLLHFVAIAVFLIIGGHRMMTAALLDTFVSIPPGGGDLGESAVRVLTEIVAQSFILGIRAAAPLMTALLLSTLVMGLISRTLPQLNILAFGFGLNSLVFIGGLFLSLGAIVWTFQQQIGPTVEILVRSMAGEAG